MRDDSLLRHFESILSRVWKWGRGRGEGTGAGANCIARHQQQRQQTVETFCRLTRSSENAQNLLCLVEQDVYGCRGVLPSSITCSIKWTDRMNPKRPTRRNSASHGGQFLQYKPSCYEWHMAKWNGHRQIGKFEIMTKSSCPELASFSIARTG